MLRASSLDIEALPLPDHHDYRDLPWPAHTADVVLTEKDAVKLKPAQVGATRVWVAALDFATSAAFDDALIALLPTPATHSHEKSPETSPEGAHGSPTA